MNSYKDLIVWQKAMDLAREIYGLSNDFPKSEEFGITSQIRRLDIAFCSAAELGIQLELAKSLSCFYHTIV